MNVPLNLHHWRRTIRMAAAGCLAAVATAACSPVVSVHGNSVDDARAGELVPGTHTREDVALILGSPSSVSLFGKETWFYIGDQQETMAFLEPEVVDRRVVTCRFDDDGVLESVESFGIERGKKVDIVDRTTPTRGNEMTILEQFIGNIGRFKDDGAKSK